MPLTATISSHINFGISIFPHTLYRVEVVADNENWYIYRRYTDFFFLHDYLFNKKSLKALETLFPEKVMLAQRSDVVKTRMVGLQAYLNTLLEMPEVSEDPVFRNFLDFKNKGRSGAHADLSADQILFETICEIKRGVLPVEFWSTYFAVLTKQGTIYILSHIYDKISSPVMAFNVSSAVHIESRPGTRVIQLVHRLTNQRLYVKLANDAQLASWLRSLADMTTRNAPSAASALSDNNNNDNNNNSTGNRESKRQEEAQPAHSKPDELSALYGV